MGSPQHTNSPSARPLFETIDDPRQAGKVDYSAALTTSTTGSILSMHFSYILVAKTSDHKLLPHKRGAGMFIAGIDICKFPVFLPKQTPFNE
jgi:hypothetical protein